MASTDASPIPIQGVAFRVTFPILDKSGGLVVGASGLDSQVSLDAGDYVACTNEATEIDGSGTYFLDLTSDEITAYCVSVIVYTTTTDAQPTVLVLYPQKLGDIRVDVESVAGAAAALEDSVSTVIFPGNIGTSHYSSTDLVNVGKWNGTDVTGMPMPTYEQPTGFLDATFPGGTMPNTDDLPTDITLRSAIGLSNANLDAQLFDQFSKIYAAFVFSTCKRVVTVDGGSPILTIYDTDGTTPFIQFNYDPSSLTLTPV